MKLFLLAIVAISFIACSPDPANKTAGNDDKDKPIRVAPEPTPDQDLGPADSVAPVSAEEDTADLVASEDTPAVAGTDMTDSEGLVSLAEVSVTPPAPVEDLVPLDLTEDQFLVAQINERYNDYVELQHAWEDYAPELEIFLDQATNQKFLDSISFIQSHMKNTPVTSSQVNDIEEKLQEGLFIYEEDREHAETKYEQLDAFVSLFETAIDLSLEYVNQAEEDPSVLYAQTTDEDEQTPEFVPVPEDTVTTVIAMAEKDTQNMPEPLVVPLAEQPVPPTTDNTPENIVTSTEKDCDNNPTMVCQTIEDSTVANVPTDPTEDENAEDDDDTNTDKETEPANEEASDDTAVAIAEKSIDDSTEKDTTTATDEIVSDIADVQPEEEETSFVEDVVAWWDGTVQWFDETFKASTLSGWVVEPTSLHIPNTSTIVPEANEEETTEETDSISEQQAKAHQLLDELIQNVNQFAQTHNVQSAEDLIPHVTEMSNITETERTTEQVALLSKIKQVAQAIDQMADGNANDFVELSGYNSESLPQVEVMVIVEMLSDVVKTDEAQQEEPVEDTLS